jgi:hypothetical protein
VATPKDAQKEVAGNELERCGFGKAIRGDGSLWTRPSGRVWWGAFIAPCRRRTGIISARWSANCSGRSTGRSAFEGRTHLAMGGHADGNIGDVDGQEGLPDDGSLPRSREPMGTTRTSRSRVGEAAACFGGRWRSGMRPPGLALAKPLPASVGVGGAGMRPPGLALAKPLPASVGVGGAGTGSTGVHVMLRSCGVPLRRPPGVESWGPTGFTVGRRSFGTRVQSSVPDRAGMRPPGLALAKPLPASVGVGGAGMRPPGLASGRVLASVGTRAGDAVGFEQGLSRYGLSLSRLEPGRRSGPDR